MLRNRNGYWMSPGFSALFAPESGGGEGGTAGAGAGGESAPGGAGEPAGENITADGQKGSTQATVGTEPDNDKTGELNAEIERLKAEIAKQKNAINDATKEAADYKRQLRAQMTAEQIAAKEKEEAAEKAAKELDDLRREVAKGKTVKTIMGKLGMDEESAGNLADYLFGAADVENAMLEIVKVWQGREAALRKEFGKITGPGTGADSNSPEAQAVRMATALGKARNATAKQAQDALGAYMR